MDRRCFLRFLSALPGLAFLAGTREASPKEGSKLVEQDEGDADRNHTSGLVSCEEETLRYYDERWKLDDWYYSKWTFHEPMTFTREEIMATGAIFESDPPSGDDLESMGMGFSEL